MQTSWKLRDRLISDGYPAPAFRPGRKPLETKLGIVEPFVPLQASDWLAYEFFRLVKNPLLDRAEWRWPMREFFKMPGTLSFYPQPVLKDMMKDLEVDFLIKNSNDLLLVDSSHSDDSRLENKA